MSQSEIRHGVYWEDYGNTLLLSTTGEESTQTGPGVLSRAIANARADGWTLSGSIMNHATYMSLPSIFSYRFYATLVKKANLSDTLLEDLLEDGVLAEP